MKADYACRAIGALARHHPDERPLHIEEIAQQGSIPANYLVQILIELKTQGLIRSRRGKAGGYTLAKKPQEITVGDVLRATHGTVLDLPDSSCPGEMKHVWQQIRRAAEQMADSITFEDVCAPARAQVPMYDI